jgi:hypothetical protein
MVPAPAIIGNAKGTIEAAFEPETSSDLKILRPKIISDQSRK